MRAAQKRPLQLLCASLALLCAPCASAFYLPGVALREYAEGERVEIKVNKITSTKTQLVRTPRPRAGPQPLRQPLVRARARAASLRLHSLNICSRAPARAPPPPAALRLLQPAVLQAGGGH